MGSYAQSKKSTNVYTPNVTDSDDALVISGSAGTQLGHLNIGSGGAYSKLSLGTLNVLDGGAISDAFEFADKTAGGLFDLTSSIIEQNRLSTTDFYNQVKDASADALNYIAEQTNTEASQRQFLLKVMAGAVAVAVLFMGFKYKWGK